VPFFPFQRPKLKGSSLCRTRGCRRFVQGVNPRDERDVDYERCSRCVWLHMFGFIFGLPAIFTIIVIWLSGGSVIDFLKGS